MYKKELFCISTAIVFLLLFVQNAHAQLDGLEENVEKLEDFSDSDTKSDYLKNEWKDVLGNSTFLGPIITTSDKVLTVLNPFSKTVLGVEASLSWAFIFAAILWLTLVLMLYPILKTLFRNTIFVLIGAFAIASLVGLSGVIKMGVNVLVAVISNIWMAFVSLGLAVIIAIVLQRYVGGGVSAYIKKAREKEAKAKEEEHRKILKIGADTVKDELEDPNKKN